MLKIDKTDLVSGIVVLAVSAFFAYGALDYRIGTMARMGPGYVPFALGVIGMVLGGAILLTAFGRAGALDGFRWLVVLPIAAAIMVFLLLLPRVGLIPATFITVLVASLASPKSRIVTSVALGVCVAILVWLCFVVLLGMPIPVLRSPF